MIPLIAFTHYAGIPLYFLFATWLSAAWIAGTNAFGDSPKQLTEDAFKDLLMESLR